MAPGLKRRSKPYQRVFKKAVRGHQRHPAASPSVRPVHTRNQILDILAAAYQRLGVTPLGTMNDARRLKVALDAQWVPPILQPAVDALRAVGLPPRDATIGAFRRVALLTTKDVGHLVIFPNESVVEAKRVAGRCRGRKQ